MKKMFYRPSAFKVRNVFDLAAVVERHPEELGAGLVEIDDRFPRLLDRIDCLRPAYATLAKDDVNPTKSGRKYMTTGAIEMVFEFLHDYQRKYELSQRP